MKKIVIFTFVIVLCLSFGCKKLRKPDAPSNLIAFTDKYVDGDKRIGLLWDDNSDNEDHFIVERSTNGVDFSFLKEEPGTETWDENLASGTKYYYRVKAKNFGGQSGYSNIASETTWELWDIAQNGIPKFVNTDYLNLDYIDAISRFRSGVGHDYSDDFETCRCMKHYYSVFADSDVFAPVSGTILSLIDEGGSFKIVIRSEAYPAFYFDLFHVEITPDLQEDDYVTEGQKIGHFEGGGQMSDIAVFVRTNQDGPVVNYILGDGVKYVSIFEVMTNQLFSAYQQRGVSNRAELIITKEERDADPLNCDEDWGPPNPGAGNIPNWVILN